MTDQFKTLTEAVNEIASYLPEFPAMSAFIIKKSDHPPVYHPVYVLMPGLCDMKKSIVNKVKETNGELIAEFAILR